MSNYTEIPPRWDAEGTQPPEILLENGWEASQKPPADYFNWFFHRTHAVLQELQTKSASLENVQNHTNNISNPHKVNASQVGTYSKVEIDDKILNASGGLADSATKLETSRLIKLSGSASGQAGFDGTADANIVVSLTGNAPSATKLETARKIANIPFDGTADIIIKADDVGAYSKEEVDTIITESSDAKIGSLDDLETINKSSVVSAINEVREKSVRSISIGSGADKIIHYPDINGDINFKDEFYYEYESGKVIAEGNMPCAYGNISYGGSNSAYINTKITPSTFLLNGSDFESCSGIAVEYTLSKINSIYYGAGTLVVPSSLFDSWKNINSTISIVTKNDDIPTSATSNSVFFKQITGLKNTALFAKSELKAKPNSNVLNNIQGSFVRRYTDGVRVDSLMQTSFAGGTRNTTNESGSAKILSTGTGAYVKQSSTIYSSYPTISSLDAQILSATSNFDQARCYGCTFLMYAGLSTGYQLTIHCPITFYLADYFSTGLYFALIPTKIYYYNQ